MTLQYETDIHKHRQMVLQIMGNNQLRRNEEKTSGCSSAFPLR